MADELQEKGLLTKEQEQTSNSKIDDIYDLSGFVIFLDDFVIFLQWVGCVLSAIFVFLLAFKCIRNRIFCPENTHIFEYFRDNRGKLFILLQKTANFKQKNDNFI